MTENKLLLIGLCIAALPILDVIARVYGRGYGIC